MGVLVVMNDEIHTARYVTKTHTTNVATFRTPTFGPIGLILRDEVRFLKNYSATVVFLLDHVVDHVYLFKAYAGMDPELLEIALNEQTNGVVIEALGAGNLPPKVLPVIEKLLAKKDPRSACIPEFQRDRPRCLCLSWWRRPAKTNGRHLLSRLKWSKSSDQTLGRTKRWTKW